MKVELNAEVKRELQEEGQQPRMRRKKIVGKKAKSRKAGMVKQEAKVEVKRESQWDRL